MKLIRNSRATVYSIQNLMILRDYLYCLKFLACCIKNMSVVSGMVLKRCKTSELERGSLSRNEKNSKLGQSIGKKSFSPGIDKMHETHIKIKICQFHNFSF